MSRSDAVPYRLMNVSQCSRNNMRVIQLRSVAAVNVKSKYFDVMCESTRRCAAKRVNFNFREIISEENSFGFN